ncbi:tetratricopeptide repeat protein [Limnoglobus roseus]|uniref:Tetratricopeptide repeat protein n=1 Tax=Limnoglobus roseus TaxID=2598579 RepID=A0A5C1AA09_9BACT|nr:tetratricopeptide repeat protein [Limnoglobus roseus]QEL16041.1 tetratricopeptide repeat protein [Limnoglobus roseus]
MRYATPFLALLLVTPFLAAADKKPAVPKGPLAEARQRLNKGNYAEARAEYTKHLGDENVGPAAAVGIANAWRAEGEYPKAFEAVADAMKAHEKNADLLATRADLLYDQGKWDEATADSDAAIKLKESHFLARWVKARITRDKGDMEAADQQMRWFIRAYNAASNADNDMTDPDTLLIVGQAGTENARWNSLSNQFRFILREVYGDALKAEPDCWRAELYSGRMLQEKYNRPQAIEAYDSALKINPNAAEAIVGKGEVALQKFELKEAEAFADQALKQNPKLPAALRLKADILFMGGDYAGAEKRLLTARELNPRDAVTLGKIAGCLMMQKKMAEFDAIAKVAEGFDAKPAVFYHELAEYLEERKLYTRAEEFFKKATDLRPKFAAPRTSLGLLYMRLGKEADGKQILDSAFKVDPFNVRVANMRKVIDHLGKYTTIQTEHYDLKFDPKNDAVLAKFLEDYLEETHADLKKQFGFEPQGRITVEVFNRHDMFSGRTVAMPDLHTVGACIGRVFTMASPSAVGLKKPFNWSRVIRHEMTHVFNLAQTDFQCPHWLTEGMATQNEKMLKPLDWLEALRDRADEGTLFNLDTVMMGFAKPKDRAEWGLAYCQSQLYVEYMVKTHGPESVGKILNAYRDGLDTAAALRIACKVEKAVFEKGYREYINEVLKPYRGAKKAKSAEEKPLTFEELTEEQKKNPDDPDLAAKLGEQLLKRGKTNESRKLIDAALAKKKGHALASLLKARLLIRAGDESGAKEVLEEALKVSPDDSRLLGLVGRFHLDAEQYDQAAEMFEKGRKLDPLDGEWDELLIRVYTASKNDDKLTAVLRDVVSRDPDQLGARVKLAKVSLDAKKYDDAEKFARDALYIDVNNEDARTALIDALTAQKKDDAVAKLKKKFE